MRRQRLRGGPSNRRIEVFDNDLKFKAIYDNVGTPWELCISPGPHQYLYSSNTFPDSNDYTLATVSGEVYKMELDGTVVGKFGKAGKQLGEFRRAAPPVGASSTTARSQPATSMTARASRAKPSMEGSMPVGSGIGEPEPAHVEADQAGELRHPLGVAEPVRLVDGLVDGDHESAVELEHVDHARIRSARPAPDLVAEVDAVPDAYWVSGASVRDAVCRDGRRWSDRPKARRRETGRRRAAALSGRRDEAPGRSPVSSPCWKVTGRT